MEVGKSAITISEKIKNSTWKRGKIMQLLNLYPNKFAIKMKYNDFDDKEIALLKKKGVID